MSKIGKKPIEIKSGITVMVQGSLVKINGPKGQFEYQIPDGIEVVVEDTRVIVKPTKKNDKTVSALFGLTRANLANMMSGAEKEFEKKLELVGVGYKAQLQGVDLVLSLGFSHPVRFTPKAGIKFLVAGNVITVSGSDNSLVGEMAANIRAVKPPEPYKGKGIKYVGEKIRKKAGKAAKAAK